MDIIIGIVGFGNVGQGLARVLLDRGYKIDHGFRAIIRYIIDPVKGSVFHREGVNLEAALREVYQGNPLDKALGYNTIPTFNDLIEDDDVDVVIEATPTNLVDGEPGYTHISKALDRGKHVITTNKGPIALNYINLRRKAESKGLYLGIEGTVMSGTPLIRLIQQSLDPSDIKAIEGILNGTTNYILTLMEEGLTFEESLSNAKEKGYAEADPSMDVNGWDLAAKASILATIVKGVQIAPDNIHRESLARYITENGFTEGLKYVVTLDFEQEVFRVEPRIFSKDHPLRRVSGVNNKVVIHHKMLGEIGLEGPGAGRIETGYAILTDLIELVRSHM